MVEMVVDLLKKHGVKGFAYQVKVDSKTASSNIEGLERVQRRTSEGIGIVVINEDRKAFVSVSRSDEKRIKEAIELAVEMSKFTEPDDGNVVSDEVDFKPLEGIFDSSLEKVDLSELKEISLSMVEKAKDFDPRIKFVRGAGISVVIEEYRVVTSEGVDKSFRSGSVSASVMCSAVDESGGSMGYKMKSGRTLKDVDPESVAVEAAKQAVEGLGAEVEKTGVYDVVLSPDAVATIFFFAFQPFSGENVYKRSSFLKKDDIGKKLFSEKLSIVNDPTDPKLVGSVPFDSEGTNTKKFYVVENGVLRNFLHNLYSAKKLEMEPTGNAFARSFKSPPSISPVNLMMVSNSSKEEIISSVDKGIYVVHVMGAHTMDPVSGRISVQISGHLIENGKLTKPVKGMAMSGYLKDLLSAVEMVGNDYEHFGSVSGSTTLIKNVSVGGK